MSKEFYVEVDRWVLERTKEVITAQNESEIPKVVKKGDYLEILDSETLELGDVVDYRILKRLE